MPAYRKISAVDLKAELQRNRSKVPNIPRRTPEEIAVIKVICMTCENWEKGCRYFAECGRLSKTKRAWELTYCNCPEEKW